MDDDTLNYLIDISEGDLRRSINLLQSISQLDPDLLDTDMLEDICGTIPKVEIEKIMEVAKYQNTEVITRTAKEFLLKGYDFKQFLVQLNEYIALNTNYPDFDKKSLFEIILNTEVALLQNSTPELQLINFLLEIRKLYLMD
jgi:replication factor C subunit 2/4